MSLKLELDMGNVFTAAQASRVAYFGAYEDPEGAGRRSLINGELIGNLHDKRSGFSAAAWKVGKNYYIAFAGTSLRDMGDLKTDFRLGAGYVPESIHTGHRHASRHLGDFITGASMRLGPKKLTQWGLARQFVRRMAKEHPEASFTVAGHSLGGALAQHVADEGSVSQVFAFNAPGFVGGGGVEKKVRHYDSKDNPFAVLQNSINGLGTRWASDNPNHSKRVTAAIGHGGGDTFPLAFGQDVRWPLIHATQMQDDGVISYSNHQYDHIAERKKAARRGRTMEDAAKVNGTYYSKAGVRKYMQTIAEPSDPHTFQLGG